MTPRRPHRPLFLATALLLAVLLAGCAGVKPDPRYTSDQRPPAASRDVPPHPSTDRPREVPNPARSTDNLDSTIERWWGTPYRTGGENRHGVDCSAYVQAVYQSVYGKLLPRHSGDQYAQGWPVDKADLQRGDLVFFNTSGRGVSHVGIYLGNGHFTHASNSSGVTIDALSSPYYAKRYLGARRIP